MDQVMREMMLTTLLNASEVFNDSLSGNGSGCNYQPNEFLETRIWLVGVVGTGTALCGIAFNSVLVYVFFRPSLRVGSSMLYLAVLAILDIWMLITYILIFPLTLFYDYFQSLALFRFWMFYVRPMLTISKMNQMASTYLIVAATVEKVLTQHNWRFSVRRRLVIVGCVILGAVALRWSSYLEISVETRPNCTGFASQDIEPSTLARNPIYQKVVSYYLNHILMVFLPFSTLLILNSMILSRMRRQTLQTTAQDGRTTVSLLAKQPARNVSSIVVNRERPPTPDEAGIQRQIEVRLESKKQLREATHMLVVVVFLYLFFNSVSLVITTMEHVSAEFLFDRKKFYSFAVDCINFLSVINSSTRFVTYYLFNGTIRREYKNIFRRVKNFFRGSSDYKGVSQNDRVAKTFENGTARKAEEEVRNGMRVENRNEPNFAPMYKDSEMEDCFTKENRYHMEVDDWEKTSRLANGLILREQTYETCL